MASRGGKHGEPPRLSITATQRKSKEEKIPVAAIGHAPCCTLGDWAHNHQVRWLTTTDDPGQSRCVHAMLKKFVPCIDQGRPASRDNQNGHSKTAAARQPSGASKGQ